MARTKINVYLKDAQLGVNVVSDGIGMIVSPGVPTTATGAVNLEYGAPIQITSLEEAVALGIDAQYDTDNSTGLYYSIKRFYQQAGAGSRLWIAIFDHSQYSSLTAYLESQEIMDLVRLTMPAQFDTRPRLIGLLHSRGTAAPAEGLSADTLTAIPAFQTVIDALFAESVRVVGFLDSSKIGPMDSTFPDLASLSAPNVHLCITTTEVDQVASVGDAIGMSAAIGLAESIGAVPYGPIAPTAYFMDGDNTNVREAKMSLYDDLGTKQYGFLRTRPQLSGVYFNDGATCNDYTNALSSIEKLRVANSFCDLAEGYFVRMLNTNIPTELNGELNAVWKEATLADLDSRYIAPRIRRGDASAVTVDIVAKDGNFQVTQAIVVSLKILSNPTLREADIYVSFVVSLSENE